MEHDELYMQCPKCDSLDVTRQTQSENSSGSYSSIWEEFECHKCGNIWEGEEGTD